MAFKDKKTSKYLHFENPSFYLVEGLVKHRHDLQKFSAWKGFEVLLQETMDAKKELFLVQARKEAYPDHHHNNRFAHLTDLQQLEETLSESVRIFSAFNIALAAIDPGASYSGAISPEVKKEIADFIVRLKSNNFFATEYTEKVLKSIRSGEVVVAGPPMPTDFVAYVIKIKGAGWFRKGSYSQNYFISQATTFKSEKLAHSAMKSKGFDSYTVIPLCSSVDPRGAKMIGDRDEDAAALLAEAEQKALNEMLKKTREHAAAQELATVPKPSKPSRKL